MTWFAHVQTQGARCGCGVRGCLHKEESLDADVWEELGRLACPTQCSLCSSGSRMTHRTCLQQAWQLLSLRKPGRLRTAQDGACKAPIIHADATGPQQRQEQCVPAQELKAQGRAALVPHNQPSTSPCAACRLDTHFVGKPASVR